MAEAGWVVVGAIPIGAWILVRGIQRAHAPWRIGLQLVALAHIGAVVGVTFFPFPYQREVIEEARLAQLAHNNLVPLASLADALVSGSHPSVVQQSIGNIVLLMPLGLYLPVLEPRARRAIVTIGAGLALSLAIELGQLAISTALGYTYKIADIDDVILNTAGVALGYTLFAIFRGRRVAFTTGTAR